MKRIAKSYKLPPTQDASAQTSRALSSVWASRFISFMVCGFTLGFTLAALINLKAAQSNQQASKTVSKRLHRLLV